MQQTKPKMPIFKFFLQDYGFRTRLMTLVSIFFNLVFVGFNLTVAIVYKSVWYGVIAGYLFVLAVQKTLLMSGYGVAKLKCRDDGEKLEKAKWKIYSAHGAVLLVLGLALSVEVFTHCFLQKPTVVGEIMAIATAAYTFYKTTMAIINIVRAKRLSDPLIQTIRNINLVDAAVSMLSLQVTLVSTFGVKNSDMAILELVLGTAICLGTFALGVYMIVHANKRLKIQNTQNNE